MDSWLGPHACLAKDHVFLPQAASHRTRAHSRNVRYRLSLCNPTPVMDSTLGATSAITAHAGDSSLTHGWLDAWVCVERNQRPCEITVKGLPAPVTSLQSHPVMDSLPGARKCHHTDDHSDSNLTHGCAWKGTHSVTGTATACQTSCVTSWCGSGGSMMLSTSIVWDRRGMIQ